MLFVVYPSGAQTFCLVRQMGSAPYVCGPDSVSAAGPDLVGWRGAECSLALIHPCRGKRVWPGPDLQCLVIW